MGGKNLILRVGVLVQEALLRFSPGWTACKSFGETSFNMEPYWFDVSSSYEGASLYAAAAVRSTKIMRKKNCTISACISWLLAVADRHGSCLAPYMHFSPQSGNYSHSPTFSGSKDLFKEHQNGRIIERLIP